VYGVVFNNTAQWLPMISCTKFLALKKHTGLQFNSWGVNQYSSPSNWSKHRYGSDSVLVIEVNATDRLHRPRTSQVAMSVDHRRVILRWQRQVQPVVMNDPGGLWMCALWKKPSANGAVTRKPQRETSKQPEINHKRDWFPNCEFSSGIFQSRR
jgi:hypothetical protein